MKPFGRMSKVQQVVGVGDRVQDREHGDGDRLGEVQQLGGLAERAPTRAAAHCFTNQVILISRNAVRQVKFT